MVVKCGEIHLLAGHVDDAASFADNALRLAEAQKERGNQAYALLLLAECRARDPTAAVGAGELLDRALGLAAELAMLPLVAHCHAGLARLYRRIAKLEQSKRHATEAAMQYRRMGMRYWVEQLDRERGTTGMGT